MVAPMSITTPERTAVKRTPILSRMIPAKIRKNTNTFRKVSEPCIVPKAVESHPRVDCIRSLMGERMSIKMYEQNMAKAMNKSTVQRMAAESRKVG
ncbi:unknown [Prevotella sp. CAG:891]|nr:unknown [Prevotella sp. CAG:891]